MDYNKYPNIIELVAELLNLKGHHICYTKKSGILFITLIDDQQFTTYVNAQKRARDQLKKMIYEVGIKWL